MSCRRQRGVSGGEEGEGVIVCAHDDIDLPASTLQRWLSVKQDRDEELHFSKRQVENVRQVLEDDGYDEDMIDKLIAIASAKVAGEEGSARKRPRPRDDDM